MRTLNVIFVVILSICNCKEAYNMTERRVVVTGVGAVTPLGNDADTMWSNIVANQSGIDFITRVNKDDFPVHVAADVKDFYPHKHIDIRDVHKMDLFSQSVIAS